MNTAARYTHIFSPPDLGFMRPQNRLLRELRVPTITRNRLNLPQAAEHGQTPLRTLCDELQQAGMTAPRVVGAFEAAELDAERAIDQASRLAAEVCA